MLFSLSRKWEDANLFFGHMQVFSPLQDFFFLAFQQHLNYVAKK